MTASDACLAATRTWVETFVVAENLCPFAGREVQRGTIDYRVIDGGDWPRALAALIAACRELEAAARIETCLLVIPEGLEAFDDYLDFLGLAETLMTDQGYEGVFQLASFHPDYCFADAEPEDPANYTNRSPWPMLHLLREASLERALAAYPDPEAIPQRNMNRLREIGGEPLAQALAALRDGAGGDGRREQN